MDKTNNLDSLLSSIRPSILLAVINDPIIIPEDLPQPSTSSNNVEPTLKLSSKGKLDRRPLAVTQPLTPKKRHKITMKNENMCSNVCPLLMSLLTMKIWMKAAFSSTIIPYMLVGKMLTEQ